MEASCRRSGVVIGEIARYCYPDCHLNGTKVFPPKCLLLTIKSALIPLQGFFIPYLTLNAVAIPWTALRVLRWSFPRAFS